MPSVLGTGPGMHYKSLKTVNQSLKHKVNRCVLSLRLNECKLSAAGRRAETSPCRITVERLHRIGEVVWAAACVDCENHQCQLELDSVHYGQPV